MDNMEVFTTVDKAKRDELYEELRKRGLPNERKVVKFSGVQPVLGEDGKQIARELPNYAGKNRWHNGETVHNFRVRLAWQSNFSVAYPRN